MQKRKKIKKEKPVVNVAQSYQKGKDPFLMLFMLILRRLPVKGKYDIMIPQMK